MEGEPRASPKPLAEALEQLTCCDGIAALRTASAGPNAVPLHVVPVAASRPVDAGPCCEGLLSLGALGGRLAGENPNSLSEEPDPVATNSPAIVFRARGPAAGGSSVREASGGAAAVGSLQASLGSVGRVAKEGSSSSSSLLYCPMYCPVYCPASGRVAEPSPFWPAPASRKDATPPDTDTAEALATDLARLPRPSPVTKEDRSAEPKAADIKVGGALAARARAGALASRAGPGAPKAAA